MATHIDDEEQLENLKQWWRENRVALIVGLGLGFGAIGGWEGWQRWQTHRATSASQMYEDMKRAMEAGQTEEVQKMGDRLLGDYAGTPYAPAAALRLAQAAAEAKQFDEAARRLAWVAEHGEDEAMVQLAKLRQARVLRALDKNDEALAVLKGDAGPYASLYLELRGDILLAKQNRAGARTAYSEALAATAETAANREMLQNKLADLAVSS